MNIPSEAGSALQSITKWKEIAEASVGKVDGVSLFAVVEDKDANGIRVQCVAQDWDAFANFQASVLDSGTGHVEMVKIRPIDGFLGREDKHKL